MSKEVLSTVTDSYKWMQHIRCSEGDKPNIILSADNRAAVLESYIGGISSQYGLEKAAKWAEDVVVTCLRAQLIQEGADLGEILAMAQKASSSGTYSSSAASQASASTSRTQAPIGTGRPAPGLVTVKRENDMDVDGEPMDTSESEVNFPLVATASPSTSTSFPQPQIMSLMAGAMSLSFMNSPSPPPVERVRIKAEPQPPAYSPKDPDQPRRMSTFSSPQLPSTIGSPMSDDMSFHSFGMSFPDLDAGNNDTYATRLPPPPRSSTTRDPLRPNPNFYNQYSSYAPSAASSSRPRTPPITTAFTPYESFYRTPGSGPSTTFRNPPPPPPQPEPASFSRTPVIQDKSRILSGALARLNERAKSRHQQPEWSFASEGQGQFINWTAKLSCKCTIGWRICRS